MILSFVSMTSVSSFFTEIASALLDWPSEDVPPPPPLQGSATNSDHLHFVKLVGHTEVSI